MQENAVHALKIISGVTVGFSLFWLTSHPKSKIKHKLPKATYKNISLLPNVTYHKNGSVYHMHHWIVLAICYITLLKSKRIRKSHTLHGLFLGSILQGLLYEDRFIFSYPKITVIGGER